MDWWDGPTLIAHLETIPVRDQSSADAPFRLPVQWVNRPHQDFRGFAGQVAGGTVKPGDAVRILPSGTTTTVRAIPSFDGDRDSAEAGDSITLTLDDEVDCSRGDVIASADDPPQVADQFEATLVWMDAESLKPGRGYWLKLGTQTVTATIAEPKYEINVNTMAKLAATSLDLNAIGVVEVTTERRIVFEPYDTNPTLGGFVLIDKVSNQTVAAGMLHFALRRAQNVHWQATSVGREDHASLKNQTPRLLWFTGLSGSGKSTIANEVEKKLALMNRHTFLLDGDNVRHGLIVLTAFISPFRAERQMVRDMLPDGEFIEIFVDTPLEVAEQRDVKGLYKKAREGSLKNFTGIDSPYEEPQAPEIRVNTVDMTAEEAADYIVSRILPLK